MTMPIERFQIQYRTQPLPEGDTVSNEALEKAKTRAGRTAEMLSGQLQKSLVPKFRSIDGKGRPVFLIREQVEECVDPIGMNRSKELKEESIRHLERKAGLI